MNVDEIEFYEDENGEVKYRPIIDKPEVIESTCLSCGFTENVPNFIYDEFARKIYHKKIKMKVSTIACGKCSRETTISAYHLKNQ